jgi:hypothetical protein
MVLYEVGAADRWMAWVSEVGCPLPLPWVTSIKTFTRFRPTRLQAQTQLHQSAAVFSTSARKLKSLARGEPTRRGLSTRLPGGSLAASLAASPRFLRCAFLRRGRPLRGLGERFAGNAKGRGEGLHRALQEMFSGLPTSLYAETAKAKTDVFALATPASLQYHDIRLVPRFASKVDRLLPDVRFWKGTQASRRHDRSICRRAGHLRHPGGAPPGPFLRANAAAACPAGLFTRSRTPSVARQNRPSRTSK